MPHRGRLTTKLAEENPIADRCYAFDEDTQHFFVKDKEHPYIQEKPFDWIRGYQVGGKSLIWARQHSDGAVLNLKDPQEMDMPLIGPSVMKIWLPGTVM